MAHGIGSNMSKASRQTVGLLAIVSGCLKTIEDFRLAFEFIETTTHAKKLCDAAVKVFPTTGDDNKLIEWVRVRMNKYDAVLLTLTGEKYHAVLLTSMATQICTDLMEKIKNKQKLAIIEPVANAVQELHDKIDPHGHCVEDFEKADELLTIAYDIFGFE